jgi:ribosome-associated heat shock protein Hsp15
MIIKLYQILTLIDLFCIAQSHIMEKEKLRIDKYLWSIRLFKTRNLAAEACDKGKVKWNGANVKASKNVHIEEEYEIKTEAKKWVIKVTGLLHTRVQYSEAINFYLDITPADTEEKNQYQAASFHTGKRLSKVGRPTKKQNRDLSEFMGD